MKGEVDKRGQQMTLGTIIMIILGITVLVFLIYGFSVGWTNFIGILFNIGGTQSNVETIRTSCSLACQTGGADSHDYKTLNRTVKTGTQEFIATCEQLSKSQTWNGSASYGVSVVKCT